MHVFESTQDIVDFFEKRGTDKWKAKGGGGGEKGEDGEDQNVVWLSEEQFRELGMPDNAKIKPARDASMRSSKRDFRGRSSARCFERKKRRETRKRRKTQN